MKPRYIIKDLETNTYFCNPILETNWEFGGVTDGFYFPTKKMALKFAKNLITDSNCGLILEIVEVYDSL